jgi:anti-sigma B factor antagonist
LSVSLQMRTDEPIRIGVVEGDVDLSSARDLSSEILNGMPTDANALILDLTHVRYLDSTGVSMLLDLHRSLEARRQRLCVVLPRSSHLWRLFEITGLPTILRIGETVDDAKLAATAAH